MSSQVIQPKLFEKRVARVFHDARNIVLLSGSAIFLKVSYISAPNAELQISSLWIGHNSFYLLLFGQSNLIIVQAMSIQGQTVLLTFEWQEVSLYLSVAYHDSNHDSLQ